MTKDDDDNDNYNYNGSDSDNSKDVNENYCIVYFTIFTFSFWRTFVRIL